MSQRQIPPAEKSSLKIGYMRLTDSAPLVIAREHGFFADLGLDVTLVREVSWANVRDRVAIGDFDAAHMLAPMPLTATLGIGGFKVPMLTGLCLARNGNAVCISPSLFETLEDDLPDPWLNAPERSAAALKKRISRRKARRQRPITLASVHPFSMHTLQLRQWLTSGGIDPDQDIRLVVLPPEQTVAHLEQGMIDGFCAGAPWPALGVDKGAVMLTTGHHIQADAPEKVLAVTTEWHQQHPGTHTRLRLALMRACAWLDQPENRPDAAKRLASPEWLDLPEAVVAASLTGHMQAARWSQPQPDASRHIFHRDRAGRPDTAVGVACLTQIGQFLRRPMTDEEAQATAVAVFQPDLYDEAESLLSTIQADV